MTGLFESLTAAVEGAPHVALGAALGADAWATALTAGGGSPYITEDAPSPRVI